MSEEKPLKVQGVPNPRGIGWLKEVQVDAARAAIQHLKEQKERQEFEVAKARGITPAQILQQGKKDLGLVAEAGEVEDNKDPEPSLQDLRNRAKELNLSAGGSKEELKARIAEAEEVEDEQEGDK